MAACIQSGSVLDLLVTLGDDGPVEFGYAEGEEGYRRVSLSRKAWEDMGMPLQITVTIEPGDRLNTSDPTAEMKRSSRLYED